VRGWLSRHWRERAPGVAAVGRCRGAARNILAEQLFVRLEETWSSRPRVHAMHDSPEQARLLQRVVTLCIREYHNA